MGKCDGKPVRLTGQALALLGDTDWGRMRTEVPVNRHVTLEHACQPAHCKLPSARGAEGQNPPSKGRAADRSQSPDIAKAGKVVEQHSSASGQQLPALGSAASSPRALSPNSYLARSGKLNPDSAQPHSSSPLSRPGKVLNLSSSVLPQHRTSSPPPRLPADSHVTGQSASCGSHGKHAGCRGRPRLTWQTALEEVRKMDTARPTFMQSLRTRSLSPRTQGARSKSGIVTQPLWQKYPRHTTPDRVSVRPAPVRRGFQGTSRTAPIPEAGPSGLNHLPNQAAPVMSQSAQRKKDAHRAYASQAQVLPWSPAGKALAARAPQAEKPSKALNPNPPGKGGSAAQQEGTSGTTAGAAPQPIRPGQKALAALLTKQAAWEQTRSISLPPVLSQITSLLQHNPEPICTLPVRSAQELISAAPQLGQLAPQPATAVERPPDQWQELQSADAAAVVAQPHDTQAVAQEAAVDLNLLSAKIVAPALKPSSPPASRSLKPEYRISLAEQIQAVLESEAQHAKRGAAQHGKGYFQGEGYFQETAGAVEAEAEEDLSHGLRHEEAEDGAWHGAEEEELRSKGGRSAEEEAVPREWEEEVLRDSEEEAGRNMLETLCDAGERRQDPSTVLSLDADSTLY